MVWNSASVTFLKICYYGRQWDCIWCNDTLNDINKTGSCLGSLVVLSPAWGETTFRSIPLEAGTFAGEGRVCLFSLVPLFLTPIYPLINLVLTLDSPLIHQWYDWLCYLLYCYLCSLPVSLHYMTHASSVSDEDASSVSDEDASSVSDEDASSVSDEDASSVSDEDASSVSDEDASSVSDEDAFLNYWWNAISRHRHLKHVCFCVLSTSWIQELQMCMCWGWDMQLKSTWCW